MDDHGMSERNGVDDSINGVRGTRTELGANRERSSRASNQRTNQSQ
jgi:hypothetical protein